jgi:putative restriction endonuclease
MLPSRDAILHLFDRIRVWQKTSHRAPHKPLLILLALGRLARGETTQVEFSEIETDMKALLTDFGPAGSLNSRHYPFWHLATDKNEENQRLWELQGPAEILNRPPKVTPTLGELRQYHIRGGFPYAISHALQVDPTLIAEVAQRILEAHFPHTLHQDILDATGISLETLYIPANSLSAKRRRDPAFREKVLLAYEYRCCVCGFDLRMGRQIIGLEAAHIKWFQAGGPDIERNGLALCVLHHKIFDLGAFTIRPEDGVMVFSQHMVGSKETQGKLMAYHGSQLIQPQSQEYSPNPEFLDWHRKEVFKTPARTA